ncbi:hypothetical protein L7F22_015532 [Adiantum nelumboides]|nr:hypothetical protein [Adiantum nelumboides]
MCGSTEEGTAGGVQGTVLWVSKYDGSKISGRRVPVLQTRRPVKSLCIITPMLGEVVCGRETLDVGADVIEDGQISLGSTYDRSWCVAKDYVKPDSVQEGLNWACGFGGSDCLPIQLGNACYLPNTVYSHASYAFNSYYQIHQHASGTCDFDGVATVTYEDPINPQGTMQSIEEPLGVLSRSQRVALGLSLPNGTPSTSEVKPSNTNIQGKEAQQVQMISDVDGAFLEAIEDLQRVHVPMESSKSTLESKFSAKSILENTFQQVEGGFPLLIGRSWLCHTKVLHDSGNEAMWIHTPDSSMKPIRLEGGMDPVMQHSSLSVGSTTKNDQSTMREGSSDDDLLEWLVATQSMPCYGVSIQLLSDDIPSTPSNSINAPLQTVSPEQPVVALGLGEPMKDHRQGKKSPLQQWLLSSTASPSSNSPAQSKDKPKLQGPKGGDELPFEELPQGWLQETYADFKVDQTPVHDVSLLQETAFSAPASTTSALPSPEPVKEVILGALILSGLVRLD